MTQLVDLADHDNADDIIWAVTSVTWGDPDDAYEAREEHRITAAFERDVAARADAAMEDCKHAIPACLWDIWRDRFTIIAAIELTEQEGNAHGTPF